MKSIFFSLVLFSLLGYFTSPLLAAVTIGSNVSIPALNGANVNSLFTVTNGIITQDIVVDGDLEISLNNIVFNGINITCGGGDITIVDCGPELMFRVCTLEHGGALILENAYVKFVGSILDDWASISLTAFSRIDIWSDAVLSNIEFVSVEDESTFNAYQMHTDDAPLFMEGVRTSIILQECELENNFLAAVTLIGGGLYFGRENIFHDNENAIIARNPDHKFTWLKESDSKFYENKATPLELDDVSEIFLINNDITVSDLGEQPIPIRVKGGTGATVIQGNTIDANDELSRGIVIFNRPNAYIEGNYVKGIYAFNPQLQPNGILAIMVGNLDAEHNHVFDNTDAVGMQITGCPGAMIGTNYLTANTRNIDVIDSYGISLESNLCSYGTDANIMMTGCQMATLCNNNCYHGADGIRLSGTNMMLEMNTNAMSYCDRGLVYRQDVLTNAQVEKGNTFLLNTLGAEFEDVTDQQAISSMSYVVRDLATEYPSHTPADWFLNTGETALDCTPMGPVPPVILTADVSRLIGCNAETSPDGKCTGDNMVALRMIEDEPDFLEEEQIEDYYEEFEGRTVDLLPMVDEIFSTCLDSFPRSTPVIEISEEGDLTDLEDQQDYMEELDDDYQDLISAEWTALEDMIDDVDGLDPDNGYEEDYQFVILQLMHLMRGDTIAHTDTAAIIDLAEGCIADDGPAVYVAQIVAMAADLPFVRAASCTAVTPRSVETGSRPDYAEELSIFPNPAGGELSLSHWIEPCSVRLYAVTGRQVLAAGGWTGSRLDIHALEPGIYILKVEGYDSPLRFVKN